ncbi:alternative oxidase 2, mitochondrial [Diutina catenulata]
MIRIGLRPRLKSPVVRYAVRFKSKWDIATKVNTNDEIAHKHDPKFSTRAMFGHPEWSSKVCESVEVTHHPPEDGTAKFANFAIQFVRRSFDLVTGYKKSENLDETFKGTRYEMDESKWLTRCIFLESIAGVPGMTAGYLRHLHSLRLMRRDRGWIETLLDEAYNEKMHLLTFIQLGEPSWFTRAMVWLSQGIFTNIFFFTYLVHPRLCHRVVGYLEEEAVFTYTHLLHQLDKGDLPGLEKLEVPIVARNYWPNLTKESTFKDLILQIRADESKHREVNHTFANLNQTNDRNPFALKVDTDKPQPDNGLRNSRGEGWERKDLEL